MLARLKSLVLTNVREQKKKRMFAKLKTWKGDLDKSQDMLARLRSLVLTKVRAQKKKKKILNCIVTMLELDPILDTQVAQ